MATALPELPQEEVREIVESYKNIFQNVTEIVNARVLERRSKTSKLIISRWKQRNLATNSNLIIERSTVTDESYQSAVDVNCDDVSQCILSEFSPSELLKATISLRETKFLLNIWSPEKLMMTFDLHELDVHGAVYYDDTFGSLSWSPREDKIVYVAERKSPKTVPFYSQSTADQSCEKKGEQYVYEEDWGEQISPKKHSIIVVCNIVDRKISLLNEGTPNDFSAGQVIWDPTGTGVVGVGFFHKPRRLGIVFCTNRPSCIFYTTGNDHYEILSDEKMSVSSPRFSPDGKSLIWLQHPEGGPHQSAFALVKCDWETKNITTIVDIVHTYISTLNKRNFYGIYCSKLPKRCWTSDSKLVIFSTPQIHRINAYAAHINDKSLRDIGSDDENESIIIHDVTENHFAIGEITSFKQPSVLAGLEITFAFAANVFDEKHFSWNILTHSTNLNNNNVIIPFTVHNDEFKNSCYASYYGPGSGDPRSVPVVLFLHGGPHVSISSSYNPLLHFFTEQGFGVIIVNYSGSLGCGNDYVHALLGNIGSLDVKDCYVTLQKSFEKFHWLDNKNVMLFGGSHGGFLVTHLSAQYPNDFKSVVTRNPAVNIPAKIFITDIPDWNAIECGFSYEGIKEIMTNDTCWKKMTMNSPMYHVRNVKAPTLIMLGKKDIRVPYLPGLSYHHALKESHVPTKVLMYDDNHSLSAVPVEMDSVINAVIWFKKCMR